ncbi:GDP-L-fucose synthase family protein [Desulfoplanes formicivorans]|uniref:GDP-L-fucose synthase n=1 Tax=Desulfoplanes formicivorans TaxID=1592317 RepID=A0A194AG61_9BACT|nr:GDP-L-fucose synthase [Desulfoplanes formicivorans]GAU09067.1 GDP-L-fucose synthase [Desulfoplanes formicivorans]
MQPTDSIYVAGHRGLVGSALCRELRRKGYTNIITRTHRELDLCNQQAVNAFFASQRPDHVFLAAAKVGGIHANDTHPARFIFQNLAIATNVIDAAHRHGVRKLLFLGSSCIYPKLADQPIKEEYLLTSALEPTNEAYAIAKIAGLKMCEFYNQEYGTTYWSAMPTNLYGPGDNFDLETSHVLPAMIRKFHEAKLDGHRPVTLWGTGSPRREFLHVDDLARACVHLLELRDMAPRLVNIGCGKDLTIRELAHMVQSCVGHEGEIFWDTTKPDGTPRKLLDISTIRGLGWKPTIDLEEGIMRVYQEYARQ